METKDYLFFLFLLVVVANAFLAFLYYWKYSMDAVRIRRYLNKHYKKSIKHDYLYPSILLGPGWLFDSYSLTALRNVKDYDDDHLRGLKIKIESSRKKFTTYLSMGVVFLIILLYLEN